MNRCEDCGRPSGLRWKCAECIGLLRTRDLPPSTGFSAAYISPWGEWWIATRVCGHNDVAGVVDQVLGLGLDGAQVGLDRLGWCGVQLDGSLRDARYEYFRHLTRAQERALMDWAEALEAAGNAAAADRVRGHLRGAGEERPPWLREAAVTMRERSGD